MIAEGNACGLEKEFACPFKGQVDQKLQRQLLEVILFFAERKTNRRVSRKKTVLARSTGEIRASNGRRPEQCLDRPGSLCTPIDLFLATWAFRLLLRQHITVFCLDKPFHGCFQ